MTKYIIEIYNKQNRKYTVGWTGLDFAMAEKMYDKPYNKLHTRRMIKIEEEILFNDKGKK